MATNLKIAEIKEILKEHNLSTAGNKTHLLNRLLDADLTGEWIRRKEANVNLTTEFSEDDANQEEDEEVASVPVYRQNSRFETSAELTEQQRKAKADALELAMLRKEIDLMKREIESLRSQPSNDEPRLMANVTSGPSIKSIGELISDFDGTNSDFQQWKRQINQICRIYKLDDGTARVVVASKLKGTQTMVSLES